MICLTKEDGTFELIRFKIKEKDEEYPINDIFRIKKTIEQRIAGMKVRLYNLEILINCMARQCLIRYELEDFKW